MIKYKKKEIHMVDISGRMQIEIIHEEYTPNDEEEWENEIKEINQKAEERMRKYEEKLQKMFITARSDAHSSTEKDADYFIHKYGDRFIDRNSENIKNRLELFNKYLEG